LPDGGSEIFFAGGLDSEINEPMTDLPAGHPRCGLLAEARRGAFARQAKSGCSPWGFRVAIDPD